MKGIAISLALSMCGTAASAQCIVGQRCTQGQIANQAEQDYFRQQQMYQQNMQNQQQLQQQQQSTVPFGRRPCPNGYTYC